MKKWLITLVAVLVLVVAVLAFLNQDSVAEKRILEESAAFVVKAETETLATYYLADLQEMESDTFEAVLKTNGKDPEYYDYEGVELRTLFHEAGVDLKEYDSVILTAIDGYSVAYTVVEVLKEDNVYLVYGKEGALLETREEGGRGPYQSIVVTDQFSNRRCKFAVEMDVR